ncbi:unnamed protein product [Vitrella brassicaformis CCMP3155]|uniref:Uncharacterized protein n=2 Tax=Vitrella brassicaformis TaxID=1169539 RepID=A0A0G4FX49_VITBC|nr:unnamed protein product [Vitrella brassicaformis CCMP3155]|eukprot:CEM19397.1 unnamed protein product [Vitrella brassicaformis CCMP3155]
MRVHRIFFAALVLVLQCTSQAKPNRKKVSRAFFHRIRSADGTGSKINALRHSLDALRSRVNRFKKLLLGAERVLQSDEAIVRRSHLAHGKKRGLHGQIPLENNDDSSVQDWADDLVSDPGDIMDAGDMMAGGAQGEKEHTTHHPPPETHHNDASYPPPPPPPPPHDPYYAPPSPHMDYYPPPLHTEENSPHPPPYEHYPPHHDHHHHYDHGHSYDPAHTHDPSMYPPMVTHEPDYIDVNDEAHMGHVEHYHHDMGEWHEHIDNGTYEPFHAMDSYHVETIWDYGLMNPGAPLYVMDLGLDAHYAKVIMPHNPNPVVIAGMPTAWGEPEVVVRISEVTPESFLVHLEESSCLDQWHDWENVDIMVLEAGNGRDLNGIQYWAGKTFIPGDQQWHHIHFPDMLDQPKVFVQVQTMASDRMFVKARVRNVTELGFEVALETEGIDLVNEDEPDTFMGEDVGWVAFVGSEGSWIDGAKVRVGETHDVGSHWHSISTHEFTGWPWVFGSITSFDSKQAAHLRKDGMSMDSQHFSVKVQNESCTDPDEIDGPAGGESVAWIAFDAPRCFPCPPCYCRPPPPPNECDDTKAQLAAELHTYEAILDQIWEEMNKKIHAITATEAHLMAAGCAPADYPGPPHDYDDGGWMSFTQRTAKQRRHIHHNHRATMRQRGGVGSGASRATDWVNDRRRRERAMQLRQRHDPGAHDHHDYYECPMCDMCHCPAPPPHEEQCWYDVMEMQYDLSYFQMDINNFEWDLMNMEHYLTWIKDQRQECKTHQEETQSQGACAGLDHGNCTQYSYCAYLTFPLPNHTVTGCVDWRSFADREFDTCNDFSHSLFGFLNLHSPNVMHIPPGHGPIYTDNFDPHNTEHPHPSHETEYDVGSADQPTAEPYEHFPSDMPHHPSPPPPHDDGSYYSPPPPPHTDYYPPPPPPPPADHSPPPEEYEDYPPGPPHEGEHSPPSPPPPAAATDSSPHPPMAMMMPTRLHSHLYASAMHIPDPGHPGEHPPAHMSDGGFGASSVECGTGGGDSWLYWIASGDIIDDSLGWDGHDDNVTDAGGFSGVVQRPVLHRVANGRGEGARQGR